MTLRELRLSDAPSLLAMLSTEEVARFISPPPTTVEGFERFIAWAHRERAAGSYICFAVVPHGMDTAVGIFQVRQLEPGFGTAEWGFAIGSAFWGSGVFARRREARPGVRVRDRGCPPARSARRSGQRPRQRRAAEDGSGAGGRASQVVPARWRIPGPNPVDDPRRRLAAGPVELEADAPLTGAFGPSARVRLRQATARLAEAAKARPRAALNECVPGSRSGGAHGHTVFAAVFFCAAGAAGVTPHV